jgi:hypothetical protein
MVFSLVANNHHKLFAADINTHFAHLLVPLLERGFQLSCYRFPDPGHRLPSLHIQAQEHSSRPRILHGMGEEGGEPIYDQAQGFRAERLPRQLFVDILHRHE